MYCVYFVMRQELLTLLKATNRRKDEIIKKFVIEYRPKSAIQYSSWHRSCLTKDIDEDKIQRPKMAFLKEKLKVCT